MSILEAIRQLMQEINLDYFIFTDADPHMSEYVNEYYKFRTLISGFTGSNGVLILGINDGYLFTDGRYFIQAEKELSGTGITLMKMGMKDCPTLDAFLNELSSLGNKIGCLEDCLSFSSFNKYPIDYLDSDYSIVKKAYEIAYGKPYPAINIDTYIEELPFEIAGETVIEKINKVRDELEKAEGDIYISSNLEANMWLLNIRGRAISHTPVAMSYVVIEKESIKLFIMDSTNIHIDEMIEVYDYYSIKDYLKNLNINTTVIAKLSTLSAGIGKILVDINLKILDSDLNINLNKAIKNEIEIENIKKYYEKDNIIVSKFINYMKTNDLSGKNEYEVGLMLDNMRLQDDECFDLSFDTISASGPNAAMMHYEATKDNYSEILKNNLYLVDSGGQWRGATTDITRTIVIGKPTYKMQHDYTRVLRGMLRLSNAVFMEGCTGVNLDILAREPMWEEGDDYKCGTGHGIGYILSVHEGPNSIRWKTLPDDVVLKPGMIMSCEPGIYRQDEYGIRIENILLVKEKCVTNDGRFLCFETLTYVPFDDDLILENEMEPKEIQWLREYKNKCDNIVNFFT